MSAESGSIEKIDCIGSIERKVVSDKSDCGVKKNLDDNDKQIDIRLLKRKEVRDYLTLLSQLSDIGDEREWTEEKRNSIFDAIERSEQTQIFVAVNCASGRLLGAATVLMEQKFLHGGARVAHIEDVVVDKQSRGQKIGKCLILHCVEVARAAGAYKTILDCDPKLEFFYVSCGFHSGSIQMRCDHKL